MPDGWDHEELLAALGETVKARQAVPEWFVETGKNAYVWQNIDAELAQLTYDSDSAADRGVAAQKTAQAQDRQAQPRRDLGKRDALLGGHGNGGLGSHTLSIAN